ncbi:class I SAM-dependent methyltransferase [Reichenbachiella agarivorans]|uniref:Class I SAM-dependent methyltransferase n=1 Tax=Reichenbachiella agarivorans TaxID=2979464 RepID=A0ABY6CUA6_9BACT|nr:class I SAM-dependent methyltransferase [Reichenbachiella agarivorans]UXP32938.1 class I SAM-dependent methyltransferase [Reichenbachiella agarivorans]
MAIEGQYNSRIDKVDRAKPKLSNSRYVHLKSLNRLINHVIDKYIKTGTKVVLADFGCGELPYHHILSPYCQEYLAIDIPGNPKANRIVDLDTNKCNIDEASCDIVWSIQVLEHVSDYNKYLLEAHRMLKNEGHIIASTHGQWKYHPDPIDYWRWTSAGLKKTFENNGFEIVEFKGSLSFLTTTIHLWQDAVLLSFPFAKVWKTPFCIFAQMIMVCTERFSKWSKTLDAHRNLDSDVYFVIARKK